MQSQLNVYAFKALEPILEHKSNLQQTDSANKTVLMKSLGSGDFELVLKLMDNGAGIDLDDVVLVREVLNLGQLHDHDPQKKAVVHIAGKALIKAVEDKNLEFFNAMDRKIDLLTVFDCGYEEEKGNLILMKAAQNGEDFLRPLLEKSSCNVNAKGADGMSLLLYLLSGYEHNMARILLSQNKNIEMSATNKWGNTALHETEYPALARLILENQKVDVNMPNRDGETALIMAINKKDFILSNLYIQHQDANFINSFGSGKYSALHAAVAQGDQNILLNILDKLKNDEIDAKNQDGTTALMVAAKNGNLAVAQLLVARNATVNSKDILGNDAMAVAAFYGRNAVVRFLLKHRSRISENFVESTAFHYAIGNRHATVGKTLLRPYLNLTVSNNRRSALMVAAYVGDEKIVHKLLSREIRLQDSLGRTALMYAFMEEDEEWSSLGMKKRIDNDGKNDFLKAPKRNSSAQESIIRTLLEYDRDVGGVNLIDKQDNIGRTALMIAVQISNREIVRILLQFDCNIYKKDAFGNTAITLAKKSPSIAKLLERSDCYFEEDVIFSKNITQLLIQQLLRCKSVKAGEVLQGAASFGDAESLKIMLANDININVKDTEIALLSAIENNRSDIVSFLLRSGVNPNFNHDPHGYSHGNPLWRAVSDQNIAIIEMLFEHGADVNAKFGNNESPLILTENYAITEKLLKMGVNVNKQDGDGDTALSISLCNDVKYVKLLLDHGADVKLNGYNYPLLNAIRYSNGSDTVVKMLLAAGALPNSRDGYGGGGMTALAQASSLGFIKVISTLLDYNASVCTKDNHGLTALMHALLRTDNSWDWSSNTELKDAKDDTLALEISKLVLGHELTCIDAQSNNAETALIISAKLGLNKTTEYLLIMGADASLEDDSGRSYSHFIN